MKVKERRACVQLLPSVVDALTNTRNVLQYTYRNMQAAQPEPDATHCWWYVPAEGDAICKSKELWVAFWSICACTLWPSCMTQLREIRNGAAATYRNTCQRTASAAAAATATAAAVCLRCASLCVSLLSHAGPSLQLLASLWRLKLTYFYVAHSCRCRSV